ncbi:hypothetical protein CCP3SC15_4340002 [Gammaproteobacteria bacterium]
MQVQHYLAVTGAKVADVAVLIGGADFRIYEVPADLELQKMMIERESSFWNCVQAETPPDPVSYADVQSRYGLASRAGTVIATPAVEKAVTNLRAINDQLKRLEDAKELEKAIVMNLMGENDTLVSNGSILATWKATKPAQVFDKDGFREKYQELYQKFTKIGNSNRRLLLK